MIRRPKLILAILVFISTQILANPPRQQVPEIPTHRRTLWSIPFGHSTCAQLAQTLQRDLVRQAAALAGQVQITNVQTSCIRSERGYGNHVRFSYTAPLEWRPVIHGSTSYNRSSNYHRFSTLRQCLRALPREVSIFRRETGITPLRSYCAKFKIGSYGTVVLGIGNPRKRPQVFSADFYPPFSLYNRNVHRDFTGMVNWLRDVLPRHGRTLSVNGIQIRTQYAFARETSLFLFFYSTDELADFDILKGGDINTFYNDQLWYLRRKLRPIYNRGGYYFQSMSWGPYGIPIVFAVTDGLRISFDRISRERYVGSYDGALASCRANRDAVVRRYQNNTSANIQGGICQYQTNNGPGWVFQIRFVEWPTPQPGN